MAKLTVGSSSNKGFEEPWSLGDLPLDMFDSTVFRIQDYITMAFHSGQVFYIDVYL